jgi:hypothetical protein
MKGLSFIGLPASIRNLDIAEKKTFRIHLVYQAIEGVILGVLAMNEYVFLKSLKGSSYQIGFLFQFSMLVFIFLIFFNEIRKRIKNQKQLLRGAGFLTRLPLAALLFFPSDPLAYSSNQLFHYLFLGIFFIYYLGNIIIYPAINVLLKTNYRHENFGRLYGYTSSLNKIVMLVVTFLYGLMLDLDFYSFRFVFPVVSALGIISIFILSEIDFSKIVQAPRAKTLWLSIRLSIRGMYRVLKDNKPYRDFEIGFMGYGFAFMMTAPVINIFLDEGLDLNYSSVAFYKNAYNVIAIILLLFTGRWMGRVDPRKFATFTFLSMGFYIFFMMLTQYVPYSFELGNIKIYYMLILSFLSYGYFAATMVLLWNIGSAYFCKPEEADDYQSNHLFLTGVRAIFAPVLGVFFYEKIGFTGTFSLTIVLLLFASWLMIISYRKERTNI